MEEFRKKIYEKIQKCHFGAIDANCDTNRGGETLKDLRELIERAYGFIGFYGLRYGKTIGKYEAAPSYSLFEFGLALNKWNEIALPPMLFLLPKECSELYETVKDLAMRLLLNDDDYKWSEAQIDEDFKKQARLKNAMLNDGISRSIKEEELGDVEAYFKDKDAEKCFFNIAQKIYKEVRTETELLDELTDWLNGLLIEIISNLEENVRRLELEKLEALDNLHLANSRQNGSEFREQVLISQKEFDLFDQNSIKMGIPGLCLLIHGSREDTTRPVGPTSKITEEILKVLPWGKETEEPEICTFDNKNKKISSVWETLWNAVAPIGHMRGDLQDITTLARALIQAKRPIIAIIYNIDCAEGSLEKFAETIWLPLFDAMSQQMQSQSIHHCRHSLTMLVTHRGPRVSETLPFLKIIDSKNSGLEGMSQKMPKKEKPVSFRLIRCLPYLQRDFV